MLFTVKYTTRNGEVLLQDQEGLSIEEVAARVRADGHFPLEVKPAARSARSSKPIKSESLIIFNQELLALL